MRDPSDQLFRLDVVVIVMQNEINLTKYPLKIMDHGRDGLWLVRPRGDPQGAFGRAGLKQEPDTLAVLAEGDIATGFLELSFGRGSGCRRSHGMFRDNSNNSAQCATSLSCHGHSDRATILSIAEHYATVDRGVGQACARPRRVARTGFRNPELSRTGRACSTAFIRQPKPSAFFQRSRQRLSEQGRRIDGVSGNLSG